MNKIIQDIIHWCQVIIIRNIHFLLIQNKIVFVMQMKNNELKMKLNQQHKYLKDIIIKNIMLKKLKMNNKSMTLMKMKMKKMFHH